MKRILVIFFLICLNTHGGPVCAQDSAIRVYKQIPYPVTYFATNLAGELFTISADNLLKKYDTNGDSVGVFNDVRKFGKLSRVSAQNPWKIILFYEDFQTIVLLDKYLNNLGNISLRDKNIFNVKAVANSYDNNIWLFDGREFKIKKVDENGNLLMSSVDFRQLFDDVPVPRWIGDSDGMLYLYDPDRGFYIFDYYGAFKMILPFKNWKSEFVNKKNLMGFDDNFLFKYSPPLPVTSEQKLPEEFRNADYISMSSRKVFVLKNRQLTIYTW